MIGTPVIIGGIPLPSDTPLFLALVALHVAAGLTCVLTGVVDELPPHAERLMTLQSWDTASKGGPDNDWSVCTTWLVTRRKGWYLLNVWRRRVDYPALKAAVQSLAKQWSARRVLVEDAVTGTALVQELRGVIPGIIAVKPPLSSTRTTGLRTDPSWGPNRRSSFSSAAVRQKIHSCRCPNLRGQL